MKKPAERKYFLNRELSWLDFNARVLEEAVDPTNALLERLKFAAIFSSNLDEFFMVRVAGLWQQVEAGRSGTDPAGLSAAEQLRRIRRKVTELSTLQCTCVLEDLLPRLRDKGVVVLDFDELSVPEREELRRYFEREVLPVLTPMAVDRSHPFPIVANGTMGIAVSLRRPRSNKRHRALVEVPKVLPRFVEVSGGGRADQSAYVLLEDLVREHLDLLFVKCHILKTMAFRLLRDMDFSIDEEGVADLLADLEKQLRRRRRRAPVRLELAAGGDRSLGQWLIRHLDVDGDAVYRVGGPLDLSSLFELVAHAQRADLLEPVWPPLEVPEIPADESVFAAIQRAGSIPLFHPFLSFDPVVRLLEEAAEDPAVLAIKQTLYRVSGGSPVVRALQRAAENGKQVTVIVEVKARFDEERNIAWARSLEESGAHVVYGIVGLKIHCKALLIVRREDGHIARYLHLATGNYNDRTAKLYTDTGMLLSDPDMCMDVAALFNVMTGYSEPPTWRRITVAPFDLRQTFVRLIDREAAATTPHQPGRIIAKMNSLVDPEIIMRLYAAAAAGVRVDLIVRGICCLRPGVETENIRVVSIVDRFLEHSRIYYFANGGRPEYYMSSADWMPRNLDRRIEVLFPVDAPDARALLDSVLELQLDDRFKGRRLLTSDGVYEQDTERDASTRSQELTYRLFRDRASRLREGGARTDVGKPLRVLRGPRPG